MAQLKLKGRRKETFTGSTRRPDPTKGLGSPWAGRDLGRHKAPRSSWCPTCHSHGQFTIEGKTNHKREARLTSASTKNVMLLQIKNKFEGLLLCRCPNKCVGCRRESLQGPPHSRSSVTRHLHLKIGVRNNGLGYSPSAIPQVMFLTKPSGAHLPVAPGPIGDRKGTGLPTSELKQTQAGLGSRGPTLPRVFTSKPLVRTELLQRRHEIKQTQRDAQADAEVAARACHRVLGCRGTADGHRSLPGPPRKTARPEWESAQGCQAHSLPRRVQLQSMLASGRGTSCPSEQEQL